MKNTKFYATKWVLEKTNFILFLQFPLPLSPDSSPLDVVVPHLLLPFSQSLASVEHQSTGDWMRRRRTGTSKSFSSFSFRLRFRTSSANDLCLRVSLSSSLVLRQNYSNCSQFFKIFLKCVSRGNVENVSRTGREDRRGRK